VDDNPYIGPAAFTGQDSSRFFGRKNETRELASLVIARRAVLLYAQSGAGKTSLLQASLIPELTRRKRVAAFPIARVMGEAASTGNLYVKNALANLFPDRQPGETLAEAFGATLSPDSGGRPQPCLLIFDQSWALVSLPIRSSAFCCPCGRTIWRTSTTMPRCCRIAPGPG
jgi:hypothetical protein